jgi:hypothetical protein
VTVASALLPSRGRPDSLRWSVATLRATAARPSEVEILVAYDPDDDATRDTACDLGAAVVYQAPERWGYHQLHRYFNELAARATGSWLLLWNDDAAMLTDGWDERLAELPSTVVVADLQTSLSPHLCCFPAVRRTAVEILGAFSAHTPHCDTYWQDMARALDAIAPVDVRVHHDRADITGGHNDQTRAEAVAGYRSHEYYGPFVQQAIAADIERLRKALA